MGLGPHPVARARSG
eukprot:gene22034-biopygen17689